MTVAFDAATESANADDPQTLTHTPVGTPRGVVVLVGKGNAADVITSVTYGGTALTKVRTDIDDAGEPCLSQIWFLGSSVPTGQQTLSVDKTASSINHIVCVTLTAAADLEVVDHDGVSGDQANPSVTLQFGGRECLSLGVLSSGVLAPSSIASLSDQTRIHDHDFGSLSSAADYLTTAQTSDDTFGFTVASDDVALSAVAIGEVQAASISFEVGQIPF